MSKVTRSWWISMITDVNWTVSLWDDRKCIKCITWNGSGNGKWIFEIIIKFYLKQLFFWCREFLGLIRPWGFHSAGTSRKGHGMSTTVQPALIFFRQRATLSKSALRMWLFGGAEAFQTGDRENLRVCCTKAAVVSPSLLPQQQTLSQSFRSENDGTKEFAYKEVGFSRKPGLCAPHQDMASTGILKSPYCWCGLENVTWVNSNAFITGGMSKNTLVCSTCCPDKHCCASSLIADSYWMHFACTKHELYRLAFDIWEVKCHWRSSFEHWLTCCLIKEEIPGGSEFWDGRHARDHL